MTFFSSANLRDIRYIDDTYHHYFLNTNAERDRNTIIFYCANDQIYVEKHDQLVEPAVAAAAALACIALA